MNQVTSEACFEMLDLCFFELGEAFKGLKDENVWKRPAENLPSVGEIAGHIAYGMVVWLASTGIEARTDVSKCFVTGPLIDPRFRYHPHTLASKPSTEHLGMTGEQLMSELKRVFEGTKASFRARNPDLKAVIPGYEPFHTYGEMLKYQVFHVAYHTGQIYTTRHLLGEETVDN